MSEGCQIAPAHDRLERILRWLCLLPALLFVLWGSGLQFNSTPSVPCGFYLGHPAAIEVMALRLGAWLRRADAQPFRVVHPSSLVRGSYVCFLSDSDHAPDTLRSWMQGRPTRLIKQVAGLPGDVITYQDGPNSGVRVNGVLLERSTLLERASDGRKLPRAPYPVRLRRDEVWLSSEHVEGLDSRYFGPVNVAALSCTSEPLWTF